MYTVPTEYKPNVVFINIVQTWYGWESLHYIPTGFLLPPYYVNYVTTMIVSRFCKGKGTFIPHCIRQQYVCPVLNTSVVRMYQVLIVSIACLAIKYKYFTKFLTFSLVFQLLS